MLHPIQASCCKTGENGFRVRVTTKSTGSPGEAHGAGYEDQEVGVD